MTIFSFARFLPFHVNINSMFTDYQVSHGKQVLTASIIPLLIREVNHLKMPSQYRLIVHAFLRAPLIITPAIKYDMSLRPPHRNPLPPLLTGF